MNIDLEGYKYGIVTDKENLEEGYIDLTVLVEDTKKEMILSMEDRDVEVGNEVEFIMEIKTNKQGKKAFKIKGRHNITKDSIEKAIGIVFPTEVFQEKTNFTIEEWRTQKLHHLYKNSRWLENLYRSYQYVQKNNGSIYGTRDPNSNAHFQTSKMFFDNARNIYFFYNIIRAREQIVETKNEGYLNEGVFQSIVQSFYMEYLLDINKIPDKYSDINAFNSHLADIKHQVGL